MKNIYQTMNAVQHIFVGILFFIIFAIIDLYFGNIFFTEMVNKTKLDFLTLTTGLILYVIGLILPDSDSEDCGSKIFYTPFLFLVGSPNF